MKIHRDPGASSRPRLFRSMAAAFAAASCVLGLIAVASAATISGGVSIDIDTNGFTPATAQAGLGEVVSWKNSDSSADHAVSFSDGVTSPMLAHHETFTRVFEVSQTLTYTASGLPGYVGTVIIGSGIMTEDEHLAELSVSVSHEGALVPGGAVEYIVSYENRRHGVDALDTVLTVTVPAGSVVISTTRDGANVIPATPATGTLVFNLGTIPVNSAGQVRARVTLPSAGGPGISFGATASIRASNSAPENEDDHSDDSAEFEGPEISVSVRQPRGVSLAVGSVLTYALEYANHSDRVIARDVTVTLGYPSGFDLLSAQTDALSSQSVVTLVGAGNPATLLLGDLNPNDSGRILAVFQISDTVATGTPLTVSARISSSTPLADAFSEAEDESEDALIVPRPGINLWVALDSVGGAEVGTDRTYRVSFGNVGTIEAHDVRVSVRLPDALGAPSYGVPPSEVTGTLATWRYPSLDAASMARPFTLTARVLQSGPLTATASITATFDISETEVEAADNEAAEYQPAITLARPYILSPRRGTITSPLPVIRGMGRAGATVSVWLSGTAGMTRSLVGTTDVDLFGRWTLTATTPITPNGWHWITARQAISTMVSGVTGAGFVVSDSMTIDPNSVTQNGVALGGLNPDVSYGPLRTYGLQMRIVACATPTAPALRMRLYSPAGLMTGYRVYTGTTPVDGWTTFTYTTPYSGVPFELEVEYECPSTNPPGSLDHHSECYDGLNCSDDPPQPPEDCEDCYPGPAPRPSPIDPDGFVHDAASVRAGAAITQAIITRAWVTATREIAPGVFAPWNALEYAQVNPQFTDSAYPDKVNAPGYYSFLVPPGVYRISATAPGYQDYVSQDLVVKAAPVTLHVPMEPTLGATQALVAAPRVLSQRVFLPVLRR